MTRLRKIAVRDRTIETLRSKGKECASKTLPDNAFLPYLEYRLIELLEEYLESKDTEALADILEAVFRVAELKGVSKEDLERVRARRAEELGAFEKNIVLIPEDEPLPERKMLLGTCGEGDHIVED
jgi:predicted house-cleaning noncanonical NTP pyrophosphatase (MazG superfamily)